MDLLDTLKLYERYIFTDAHDLEDNEYRTRLHSIYGQWFQSDEQIEQYLGNLELPNHHHILLTIELGVKSDTWNTASSLVLKREEDWIDTVSGLYESMENIKLNYYGWDDYDYPVLKVDVQSIKLENGILKLYALGTLNK
jgi:hypothetical protein